jgi:hypothetical protein
VSKDYCNHFLVRGIFLIKTIHEPPSFTQHLEADRHGNTFFMLYDNIEVLILR